MQRSRLSIYGGLLLGLSLTACGGSSGPADPEEIISGVTLAGVVAAGAPLIGYVSIKDSTGASVVDYLDENGGYSADISELSPPYLLYASGTVGTKVYTLLSAATAEDQNKTVNVTPLTNLIVANAVGASPEAFYNNPDFSKITATSLETQEDLLEERLAPLLAAAGVAADFDIRNSAFTPDHSGIDAVLDVIEVTVDEANETATITNVLDDSFTITDDLADSTDNSELSAGTVTTSTLTEIQKLTDGMDGVALLHASNVTDSTEYAPALADGLSFDGASKQDLLDLFVSTDTSARQMVTNFMEGTKVFSLESMDLSVTPAVAWVTFGTGSSAVKFTNTGANGAWQFAGNERDVNVSLIAETFANGSSVNYVLTPDVSDFSAMLGGAPSKMQAGDYFVVSGPGLPTSGLVLIQSAFNDTTNGLTLGKAGEGWGYGLTAAELEAAGVADSSVYTFKWYRDVGSDTTFGANGTILYSDVSAGTADTLVDEYPTTLAKRPPAATESANFPTLTAPTSTDTTIFAAGSLAVSWTLPAGSRSDVVWLDVDYSDGTRSRDAEAFVAEDATSTTLTVGLDGTKTVSAASLYVSTRDAFGRYIVRQLNMTVGGGDSGGGTTTALAELVGSWSEAATPTKPTLVLNADGSFAWMELGGVAPNGIETGTYTADASNIITTVTVDGIGTPMAQDGGIDNGGAPVTFTYSYNSTTDEMTLNFPDNADGSPGPSFVAVRTKLSGAFDNLVVDAPASHNHVLLFYPNGYYFQWCNDISCGAGTGDSYELGTYSMSGQTLTVDSHIAEGAGGLDPVGMSFDYTFSDGNATTGAADMAITFTGGSMTVPQVKDATNPVVGAWHMGASTDFNSASSEVLVFYADGSYFQWSNPNGDLNGCLGATTPLAELGSYSYDSTLGRLNITGHTQNGVGGFDLSSDGCQPAGVIENVTVSADGKTLSFTDFGLSFSRVE